MARREAIAILRSCSPRARRQSMSSSRRPGQYDWILGILALLLHVGAGVLGIGLWLAAMWGAESNNEEATLGSVILPGFLGWFVAAGIILWPGDDRVRLVIRLVTPFAFVLIWLAVLLVMDA